MAYIPTGITSIVNTVPSSVIVGASVFGSLPPSSVMVLNPVSVMAVNPSPASVLVLNPVSILAVNPNPASVQVLNPVSLLGTTQIGIRITSIVSAIPSSVIVGASIFGQLPAGTAPIGSVAVLQGTNPWIIGNSSVQVLNQPANQSVSGTVDAAQIGTYRVSVISSTPSSMLVGASIFGQLPAGTAPLGSVAVLQGTNPWVVNFANSSILAVPVGSVITANIGSVIAVLQAPSIVGTYAEDAAHTTADKGLFILAVRNDAIASFVSANLEYTPRAVDSAGRDITKPFAPEESRVEGVASVVHTSVTTLIAAAGAGLRNYITDIFLSNGGSVATTVTFRSQGGTSILGNAIVPAGGGNNIIGLQIPMRTPANESFDFQASNQVSVLYANVFGFKAP